MPKITKNSKKASSASSKKSGLKKRFDLTNKKVQFFVVIAIVAVLGGGWFTYRSFAATPTILYKQCTPGNCLNASTLGINAFNGNDAQKNNMQLYRLAKDGRAYTSTFTLQSGTTYKYCATVRADKPVFIYAGIAFQSKGGAWDIGVGTTWSDQCTPNLQGPFSSDSTGASLTVTNPTTTNVYVSKIFVLSDKAPVQQPAPSSK